MAGKTPREGRAGKSGRTAGFIPLPLGGNVNGGRVRFMETCTNRYKKEEKNDEVSRRTSLSRKRFCACEDRLVNRRHGKGQVEWMPSRKVRLEMSESEAKDRPVIGREGLRR